MCVQWISVMCRPKQSEEGANCGVSGYKIIVEIFVFCMLYSKEEDFKKKFIRSIRAGDAGDRRKYSYR